MWSTPSLPSLPGPLWPRVVAPDRVLFMDENRTKLCIYAKLNCLKSNCFCMLNWIVWNRTVYIYKNRFGINNLQWLMCHKTKPNQTNQILIICLHTVKWIYIWFVSKWFVGNFIFKWVRTNFFATLVLLLFLHS